MAPIRSSQSRISKATVDDAKPYGLASRLGAKPRMQLEARLIQAFQSAGLDLNDPEVIPVVEKIPGTDELSVHCSLCRKTVILRTGARGRWRHMASEAHLGRLAVMKGADLAKIRREAFRHCQYCDMPINRPDIWRIHERSCVTNSPTEREAFKWATEMKHFKNIQLLEIYRTLQLAEHGKPPVDRHNPPGEKCHAQVSYESRRNSRRLETLPILAVGEPTGPFIPVLAVDHGPKSHTGAARTCGPQEAGSQPTVDHVSFRGAFGRQFGCCQSDPIPRTHYTQHAKLKYSHNNEPFSLRHQAHHCCHRFRAAQHYRPTMQSSLFLQPSTQWPSTRSGPGHNARVTRQQLYSRPSGMRPRSHTNRFVDFIPAPQTFGPQAPFPSLSNVTRVPERRAV